MKLTRLAVAAGLAACCLSPAAGQAAGNLSPVLVLMMRDSSVDSPPADICYFPPGNPPYDQEATLHCHDVKSAVGSYGFLSVHVGDAENGFLGLPFGVEAMAQPVTFVEFVPCPGFMLLLSEAGMPSAILVISTSGCRQPREAVGYLKYVCSGTSATYFDIRPNADLGHNKVINCDRSYDEGTAVGMGAQWGGAQTLLCEYVWLGVEATTWGGTKAMFR